MEFHKLSATAWWFVCVKGECYWARGGCDEVPSSPALGPNISAVETDFHTKSRLSPAGWGSLWYGNRANLSSSDCCHVFIFRTRCPFANLWLALALFLKRLVLNQLILDCCRCSSEDCSFSQVFFHSIAQRYHYVTRPLACGCAEPQTWTLK